MKKLIFFNMVFAILISACTHKAVTPEVAAAPPPTLTKVAEFKGMQVTGVTITDDGRLFANFPRWHDKLAFSVAEVATDGSVKPYPNQEWNNWTGKPEKNHFTSVQSIIAYGSSLYVLDPANPYMKGVVGTPKLYEFDLKTNQLTKTWEFNSTVAPKKSYLNDFRFDETEQKMYITDSGTGAIVILDLQTGKSRRVLDKHPSTKAEQVTLKIEGKPFLRNGKRPEIHADGIEISSQDQALYYHALTGYHLYRIPLVSLNDKSLSAKQLGEQVIDLGTTPAPDGMILDGKGNLFMADLEKNAVVYRNPLGEIRTLVQDPEIKWADTFTIDSKNNMLIFTTSRVAETPSGKPIRDMMFNIYRFPLPNN